MPGQTQDSGTINPARPRESPLALGVRWLLRWKTSRAALVVLGIIVICLLPAALHVLKSRRAKQTVGS